MVDTLKQSTQSSLIAAGKVEGAAVFDRQGEKLGTIKDIYLDKRSGHAEFASLAFGGVLGMGEKYHPVPWSVLDYDVEMEGFVIDVDKGALEASPAYENDRLGGPDYGWGGEVSTYYSAL
jgi:sporulation protein YlmC with PRC-barrel domain